VVAVPRKRNRRAASARISVRWDLARGKAGVSVAGIAAEASWQTRIVGNEYRANQVIAHAKVIARPMKEHVSGEIRPVILVLSGAVALMLLIGCFNVANLTLARASGRHWEIVIRAALGAPWKRIMNQVLTESPIFLWRATFWGFGLTSVAVAVLNSSRHWLSRNFRKFRSMPSAYDSR
jgi:hypothetical protein